MTKTTKNEQKSKPSGNSRFAIRSEDMTTDEHKRRLREKKNGQDADRKAKASKSAKGRERLERQKELGDDAPMTVDQLEAAIEDIRDSFGIVLTPYNLSWMANQQKLSARDLFAAAASVEGGTTYRDRVQAVDRLSRMGFRVGFTADGPKPSAVS